jgi:hypothetical protein
MAPVPRGGFRFPCMNLRDEVGEDEAHPLAARREVIGTLNRKIPGRAYARVDGGVVPNRMVKTGGEVRGFGCGMILCAPPFIKNEG